MRDLGALPAAVAYPVVIGIQVFQHGDRAAAHAHIRAAQRRLTPGGLFCLRVNATATDIWPRHEVTGRHPDGGLTVRYLTGPKQGLLIHFFADAELGELFAAGFTPVLPPRLQQTRRDPPQPGQWSQWEAIWHKTLEEPARPEMPLAMKYAGPRLRKGILKPTVRDLAGGARQNCVGHGYGDRSPVGGHMRRQ